MDLLQVVRDAGCTVVEEGDWAQRGMLPFAPLGVMLHHTAGGKNSPTQSLQTVINGREDLRGPLCNLYVDRTGSVHLVAARRANHAGKGAQEVLDELRQDTAPSADAVKRGLQDAVNGNALFYGIEVENDGLGEPYPDAVIEATVRACVGLCRAHGWSANRVIHHREWTKRKIDMSYRQPLRAQVAARL
jgi:hypothetical protein